MKRSLFMRLRAQLLSVALGFAANTAFAGTLTNGTLTVVIREDNGAINNVTLGTVEFFRQGAFVSDWGLQVGSTTSTFAINNANGAEGIAVNVTGGNVASGTYAAGGVNVAVSRTYSLVAGQNDLQIVNMLTNNGATPVTLRYFDTFDPDQGVSVASDYLTYNDKFALSGVSVAQARINLSGNQPTVVMGIVGVPSVVSAGGSYFSITNGATLNNVQSTPADGNDALADVGLHLITDLTIAPGQTVSFTSLLAFGTTPAAAQAAFSSDLPDPPPTVVGNPVTSITASGATLNGTVNPNGYSTSASFEYGLTTSYGSSTSAQAMGSGTTVVAINASLSGLLPNTVYHYRLVANNSGGTSSSTDQTFTTSAIVPLVSALTAGTITTSSASLSATVNPNRAATSAYFEYGPTLGYGSSTSSQALGSGSTGVPLLATLSGLSVNSTYHYRVVATNAAGTTVSADQTFSTLPLAPALTLGSPSGITTTSATLNVLANPNGNATNVQFTYGLTTAYGSITSPQAIGNGATLVSGSAALTGLTPNTTYHYRAVATNDGGSTLGADQVFTTIALVPSITTGSPTSVTSGGATLNANVNPNTAPTTVTFQYGLTTAYGSTTAAQAIGSGGTSVPVSSALSSLSANTTYHFRVVATNSGGTSNGPDQVFITVASPPILYVSGTTTVSQTGAGLHCIVGPNGAATTVFFEYGPTTSYGSQTATQPLGSGLTAVGGSGVLSALLPNTTYHARAVAANTGGATNGPDFVFTTGATASSRRSTDYSMLHETADQGGKLASSTNYNADGSVGDVAGYSAVASPAERANHGFIGQLADATGIQFAATPATINEESTRRITGALAFDDETTATLEPTLVSWSMTGPLLSLAIGGLGTGNPSDQYLEASAGTVYDDTGATVDGSYAGFAGSIGLTVLDTLPDNYGLYAADGIGDDWQIMHFGFDSANAAPTLDGDHDGLSNFAEFAFHSDPATTNIFPVVSVRNGAVFEYTYTRSVEALNNGLQFVVQWSDSLLSSDWHTSGVTQSILSDNGTTQQVKATVPAAGAMKKFVRLAVSPP